jgi:hypothetical protein
LGRLLRRAQRLDVDGHLVLRLRRLVNTNTKEQQMDVTTGGKRGRKKKRMR